MIEYEDWGSARIAQLEQQDLERYQQDISRTSTYSYDDQTPNYGDEFQSKLSELLDMVQQLSSDLKRTTSSIENRYALPTMNPQPLSFVDDDASCNYSEFESETIDEQPSVEEMVVNKLPDSMEMLDFKGIQSNDSSNSEVTTDLEEYEVSDSVINSHSLVTPTHQKQLSSMDSGFMVLSIYCTHMASKWNDILEMRPEQSNGMSVEVYYDLFFNWKKNLEEVNYIGGEESYIDDFFYGLKRELAVRVWEHNWKPHTLYGAFRRAALEEAMMKNDAHMVLEEMPNTNYIDNSVEGSVIEYERQSIPGSKGIVNCATAVKHSIDDVNKLNEENDGVFLGKMANPNNVCKVFDVLTEPFLEEDLLSIEALKDTHYIPMLSPVDSDENLYGKKFSLYSFPYNYESGWSDNGSTWICALLLNLSKVSIQDVSFEDDILVVSVANSLSLSKLGFNPEVFDPGSFAIFKQKVYESQLNEIQGHLHCVSLVLFQVLCSLKSLVPRNEYIDKAACSLFDNMSKQYSSKHMAGVEGLGQPTSGNWEPFMVDFKDDAVKMMFGEMVVFLFDPGIGYWPLKNGRLSLFVDRILGPVVSTKIHDTSQAIQKVMALYMFCPNVLQLGNFHEKKCPTFIVNKRIRGMEFSPITFIRYNVSDIFMIPEVLSQNAILLYILEDKENFERVGKDILFMDSILLIMSNWCNDSDTHCLMNGVENTMLSPRECFRSHSITFLICQTKSYFIWLRPILQMVVRCVLNNSIMTSSIKVELAWPAILVDSHVNRIRVALILLDHTETIQQAGKVFSGMLFLFWILVFQLSSVEACPLYLKLTEVTIDRPVLVALLENEIVYMKDLSEEQSLHKHVLLQALASRHDIPFSLQLGVIEPHHQVNFSVHLHELDWMEDYNKSTTLVFRDLFVDSQIDIFKDVVDHSIEWFPCDNSDVHYSRLAWSFFSTWLYVMRNVLFAAARKTFEMVMFTISHASYSLWQCLDRNEKCRDIIPHLTPKIDYSMDGYLQHMRQYEERLAYAYLKDNDGVSHEVMADTRIYSKCTDNFTTKLEHYIWDPGSFIPVLQAFLGG